MLFDFSGNNILGIEITSNSIRIVELGPRGDFVILVNYVLAYFNEYYDFKHNNDFVYKMDENIIDIIKNVISKNKNIETKNVSLSMPAKYNKRMVLTLPKTAIGMEALLLPLEIKKYYYGYDLGFDILSKYDYTFKVINNNILESFLKNKRTRSEDYICVIVDFWRSDVLDTVSKIKNQLFFNLKFQNPFDSFLNNLLFINSDYGQNGMIINFNIDSVSFGFYEDKELFYIDSINKGIYIIVENLVNTFGLDHKQAEQILDDYSQGSEGLKSIYRDNISSTVNNLLKELLSLCNNVAIEYNFNTDNIFITGDISVIKKDIVSSLCKAYKKDINIIDSFERIRLDDAENSLFFNKNKNSFDIAASNAVRYIII